MATFQILPAHLHTRGDGWVVKTTHENGTREISILYATQAEAQNAAGNWADLEEDWKKV